MIIKFEFMCFSFEQNFFFFLVSATFSEAKYSRQARKECSTLFSLLWNILIRTK